MYILSGTPFASRSYCLSIINSSSSPVSLSIMELIFKALESNTITSPSLIAVKYDFTIPCIAFLSKSTSKLASIFVCFIIS